MKVSVIVGFYKKLDFLDLILQGLNTQSLRDFEVIIAEDNNSIDTINFIDAYKQNVDFPIHVVQQEDIGFRKNKIYNQALLKSSGEVLVFFDGDCIPHAECLKEHYVNTQDKIVLSGRRVLLSKKLSKVLLQTNSISKITFLNLLLTNSKHIEEAIYLPYSWVPKKKNRGLLGCNFSLQRKALLDINGFDEDYEKAGVGEDTDIEWRLLKIGYTIQPIKFKAIVYHIHHDSNYKEEDVLFNAGIMRAKIKIGDTFCKNGLIKHV
jgi:glycosyltransferase involved in cell wall biosynthesis